MPCYKPTRAWMPLEGGQIVFSEKKNCREISVPCQSCIGCRLMRKNAWVVRCTAEAQMHKQNWFITWTYSDEHLPLHGSLDYRDMQLCKKRVRKEFGPFRYLTVGEYGDRFGRCHFHSLMFGLEIPDLERSGSSDGNVTYRSKRLSELWGKGFASIGTVTPQSIAYCAGYVVKKVSGPLADERYTKVDVSSGELVKLRPEFARMSLKPGIGASWVDKYWREIVTYGAVVGAGGVRKTIPRFFNNRMDSFDDDGLVACIQAELQAQRVANLEKFAADNTPERLAVREVCAQARVNQRGGR